MIGPSVDNASGGFVKNGGGFRVSIDSIGGGGGGFDKKFTDLNR